MEFDEIFSNYESDRRTHNATMKKLWRGQMRNIKRDYRDNMMFVTGQFKTDGITHIFLQMRRGRKLTKKRAAFASLLLDTVFKSDSVKGNIKINMGTGKFVATSIYEEPKEMPKLTLGQKT